MLSCRGPRRLALPVPQVYGLPSIMLFRGGEEVRDSRREGGITYEGLVEYLNRNQVWRTRG